MFDYIPKRFYDWETWNCYHLAQFLRTHHKLSPIPEFDYVSKLFLNEIDKPRDFIEMQLERYARKREICEGLHDFDLVLIRIRNVEILATHLNNHLIYMGNVCAEYCDCYRLSPYIISVWQYEN